MKTAPTRHLGESLTFALLLVLMSFGIVTIMSLAIQHL